jgi:phage gp46-like protein
MSDISLIWDALLGGADSAIVNGQIVTGNDLVTSYIISLFSDRLADPSDELPPGETDRRGWWGDTLLQEDNPGDLLGSRLWLLARAKSDASLPGTAKGYIAEALQWVIDDGVVAQNVIDCFFLNGDQERLYARVKAYRPDGSLALDIAFDWAWQQSAPAATAPFPLLDVNFVLNQSQLA